MHSVKIASSSDPKSSSQLRSSPIQARMYPQNWIHPIEVQKYFPHKAPLEIDLGCGKGRFLLNQAIAHPQTNYLGIDRMLRRIRKLDKKIILQKLPNVRLLRMEAYYAVVYLIPSSHVQTYYIFFPDPWPKSKHHKNRIFNEAFLNALYRTLATKGRIHVATDHAAYFKDISMLLSQDKRFNTIDPFIPPQDKRTDFELLYLGEKTIWRCSFEKANTN